jgi:DNA-binding response OmpR family regulator
MSLLMEADMKDSRRNRSSGKIACPLAHILVVDDEPDIVTLLQIYLERAGYAVDGAGDGLEALTRLRRTPAAFDLVITDVNMPLLNGYALLVSMRAEPSLKDLPVIVLTAHGSENEMTTGYVCGADIYLTKPFDMEEVVAFVRRCLPVALPCSLDGARRC